MSERTKDEVPGATPLRDTPLSPAPIRHPQPGKPEVPGAAGATSGPSEGPDPDGSGDGDQAARQGFDRQRLEPQDTPPADVQDDNNLAGEKDFELQPPPDRATPD